MENNYLEVSAWTNDLVVPSRNLKGVTFLATDTNKQNIMECRLLRIEAVARQKSDYEGVRFSHTFVLNIAGKGIVKTQGYEDYFFFLNEQDLVDNRHLKLTHKVEDINYQFEILQSLFGNVTSLRKLQVGFSPAYVTANNYAWSNEDLCPDEVGCYMDASRIGVSYGYDGDMRLFAIDGKASDKPIIYTEPTDDLWVSRESETNRKVYLTKEECVKNNALNITRFSPEEEDMLEEHWLELALV